MLAGIGAIMIYSSGNRTETRREEQTGYRQSAPRYSTRDKWTAFLFCLFLGWAGGHYFYVGRSGKGLLYLFTGGLFFFGWFIDLLVIFSGSFKDDEGKLLA